MMKELFTRIQTCAISVKNNKGLGGKKEKPFTDHDPKVRDHDHLTGKYLGRHISHVT